MWLLKQVYIQEYCCSLRKNVFFAVKMVADMPVIHMQAENIVNLLLVSTPFGQRFVKSFTFLSVDVCGGDSSSCRLVSYDVIHDN